MRPPKLETTAKTADNCRAFFCTPKIINIKHFFYIPTLFVCFYTNN